MDQAAAALAVLADGRRVSVINAPAGAGKTRVLAALATAWREAGLGPVIGITASQSARNTLAAGGIESYNSAQFLGHLPGRRGARGHLPIAEGTLLAVDEASMLGTPDLADLIDLAARHGGKVIVAGDTEQLQAVSSGGGMSLLADRLGYVRLMEPVRFRAGWERAASLRLRDGDATALADYDRHARITGGDPERDDRDSRRRLHRPGRERHRRAADRGRPRPAPGTVAPRPGEPAPPRPRRRRPDGRPSPTARPRAGAT